MSTAKAWLVMLAATLLLGGLLVLGDKAKASLPGGGGNMPYIAELEDKSGLALKFEEGAMPAIASVAPGSVADLSGLKAGDKVRGVASFTVRTKADVENRLRLSAENGNMTPSFNIIRDGKTMQFALGKVAEEPRLKAPVFVLTPELGMNVQDMPGMYPAGVRAPMTFAPRIGSLTDKAGLKAGEWVIAVNGKEITTAAEYRELTAGDGPLAFTVLNTDGPERKTREITVR